MLLCEGAVGDHFLLFNFSKIFMEPFIHQTSAYDRVCDMKLRKKFFQARLSRNSQHFRIPTQPVILVVNRQFSDFYLAVIIRQGLSSPYVQPLFDLQ